MKRVFFEKRFDILLMIMGNRGYRCVGVEYFYLGNFVMIDMVYCVIREY